MRVIDSHTEGEPTRVIFDGGPELGSGSLQERMRRFQQDHDTYHGTAINEPRGSDAVVGALLGSATYLEINKIVRNFPRTDENF